LQSMTTIWRSIKYPISILILGLLFSGCESDYTKLVKSELAKGIRKDSILLGIRFGNTRNEFYGKCFDLNQQHLISQGPGGVAVQYLFTDSLVHHEPTQIRLLFVPSFDDKEILTNMDLKFNYVGWTPGNRRLQADSLEGKIMELLMHWYGGNKFVIANVGDNKVPVKLDGNRRVLVYRDDPQGVVVWIQDILHPKFKHSIDVEVTKKDSKE